MRAIPKNKKTLRLHLESFRVTELHKNLNCIKGGEYKWEQKTVKDEVGG